MSKPSRKRTKLECEECGSQFDDDYKTRHEAAKHNGNRVKVKHVGAPLNPFEASKRKPPISSIRQCSTLLSPDFAMPEHPTASSTQDLLQNSSTSVSSKHLTEVAPSFPKAPTALTGASPSQELPDQLTLIPEPSSTSLFPSKETDTWVQFSGKIAVFLTNFEGMSEVLSRMKNEAVTNLTAFFNDVTDCLKNINEESEIFFGNCKRRGKQSLA